MNKLDIIISVIILIPALLGLKNGLLKSIFSLAGIITGLYLATRYNDKLVSLLKFIKTDEKILSFISFVFIILTAYFIFTYISGKISGLNFITRTIDKISGTLLGIFKGLIIASIFLVVSAGTFKIFSEKEISVSVLYPVTVNIAPDVYNYVIKFFPEAKSFYEELSKMILRTN